MSANYENSTENRQRLYERTKDELVAKQTANATSFDTAVLTLSSAFLGITITFIKDVIAPLSDANWLPLLYLSWLSFCLAIVSTVVSFMVGQASIRDLIVSAQRYYLEGDPKAYEVSVLAEKRIRCLNTLNGVLFIVGTLLLLVFIISNFHRIASMPNTRVSPPAVDHRGQPVVPFQQVPSSAPVQPAPTPQAPSPPPMPPNAGTKSS